ncbi:Gti1/Pac2 family-domain-containing protein [Gorgonomyces haynaldii]|nr:Gti1/Pac2 family-domain-containing protein [Gorgonomyces haynaldii]
MQESFHGYISTPLDAAILISCCFDNSGLVKPIHRRLGQKERDRIESGSCYVFDEAQSGMRRWTDGMRWSKSRVEGQFLVYRRLPFESPVTPPLKRRRSQADSDDEENRELKNVIKPQPMAGEEVLCKKTFAIQLNGNVTHVVCYYTKADVYNGKLQTPSQMAKFKHVTVLRDYLDPQNFRLHPKGSGYSLAAATYGSPVTISDETPEPPRRTVTVLCHGDYKTMQFQLPADVLVFNLISEF